MGHRDLGGKTILYLIDGLFGGYYWEAQPARWVSTPFGDGTNGDWPSSLFASQDPVAIDSVAYDFLLAEWPRVVTGGSEEFGALLGGEQDYLHEAALASDPPSGTFYDPEKDGAAMSSLGVHEHWNNPTAKQYSRNRGLAEGIELVSARVDAVTPRLVTGRGAAGFELSWPAAHVGYRLRTSGRVPATTWTNVSAQPEFRAGRNVVTLMSADRSAFYRLAK